MMKQIIATTILAGGMLASPAFADTYVLCTPDDADMIRVELTAIEAFATNDPAFDPELDAGFGEMIRNTCTTISGEFPLGVEQFRHEIDGVAVIGNRIDERNIAIGVKFGV